MSAFVFEPPALRPFIYTPPTDGPDILFADDHILIVNKPAGLLTVPGKTEDLADCLESRLQANFPSARIVHRLDADTSGIMVLGLTAKAHAALGLQFEKRQTGKTYIARIWGRPGADRGEIDLPMRADWPSRPRQMIDHEQGRKAITGWRILESDGISSRVELTPLTGRSHQLRLHMAQLGHPILGDNIYAHDEAYAAALRLQLHAQRLQFNHPESGERLEFSAPPEF